jgi:hypothetical protein
MGQEGATVKRYLPDVPRPSQDEEVVKQDTRQVARRRFVEG